MFPNDLLTPLRVSFPYPVGKSCNSLIDPFYKVTGNFYKLCRQEGDSCVDQVLCLPWGSNTQVLLLCLLFLVSDGLEMLGDISTNKC